MREPMLSRRRPWTVRLAERDTFLNKCPGTDVVAGALARCFTSPPVPAVAIALVADGCAPSGPHEDDGAIE